MKSKWKKAKKRKQPLGQRRKKIQRIKLVFFFIFVLTLLTIAAWLFRHPSVLIQNITVTGNVITKTEEIVSFVESKLDGSFLFVVPKQSTFFYPENEIEQGLQEKFTRIERVSARKINKTDLSITVVERDPYALWCDGVKGTTTIESSVGQCYFVDDKSYIFAKAPRFTGNVFFTYFGKLFESGETASSSLNGQYMEENEFGAFNVFLEGFAEHDFEPISLSRIDDKDFEIGLASGASIIFGTDTRLSTSLDNLSSVVQSDAFSEVDKETLEYIDLRFGNRVYYKLKGEEVIEQ